MHDILQLDQYFGWLCCAGTTNIQMHSDEKDAEASFSSECKEVFKEIGHYDLIKIEIEVRGDLNYAMSTM